MTEPMSPMTPASKSTDRPTWRRVAPSARKSASSRDRCATRMLNVLTMRNEPTTSATPAKTSRNVVMKPSASWMSLAAAWRQRRR